MATAASGSGYTDHMTHTRGGRDARAESSLAPQLGRHNARVTRLRKIIRREEADLTVVDGLKLVRDLAAAHLPIVELFTIADHVERLRAEPGLRRVLEAGRAYLLDDSAMANLAPTRSAQGVLAVVAVPRCRLGPEGTTLYLDRVQDPGNVGGIIRNAAAFGVAGVACSAGCADPFSPRAVRASAGHALLVPVQADAPFGELAEAFRRAGGEVVGTGESGGTPLSRWSPRRPVLLALGNEGQGLADDVAGGCSSLLTIPLTGGVESLNVAVTCGIVLAWLSGVAGSPILERQAQKARRR
jgi:TrmH family RNA methyltransferase